MKKKNGITCIHAFFLLVQYVNAKNKEYEYEYEKSRIRCPFKLKYRWVK